MSESAKGSGHCSRITRKSTIADMAPGSVVSIRKITAGASEKKFLLDNGITVGCDLTVLGPGEDGILVEDGRGRKVLLSDELAASMFLQEPLKRHLDPMISGGCCTYGNTAGALDMMNKVNEETFGENP